MINVGDKVVCIDPGEFPHIVKGRVYEVEVTHIGGSGDAHPGEAYIGLVGVYSTDAEYARWQVLGRPDLRNYLYRAVRFRKIQKADDKFIARIKACKPNLVTV